MADSFPRGIMPPDQSPLYWVSHKDRYLRQLLISDIQVSTGRNLIVYFTDTDNSTALIDPGDDQYLYELLKQCKPGGVDLLLETPGGFTDTTEKLCAMLRSMAPDLRVIVPRRAKSNGTLMALAAKEILMSATSELGPIDPSINNVPAEFILNDPQSNPIFRQVAMTAAMQTKRLAKELLKSGMMSDQEDGVVDAAVEALATRQRFHSHGSVVDAREAAQLGLKVNMLDHGSELWQQLWLLRSMYAYDAPRNGHVKIFEGVRNSTAVAAK